MAFIISSASQHYKVILHSRDVSMCTSWQIIAKQFYGKKVNITMGITLLFKVPTSDIHDVKYDQGYQNKKRQ